MGLRSRMSAVAIAIACAVGGAAATAAPASGAGPAAGPVPARVGPPAAAPGALDRTFSGDGVATISFGNILRRAALLDVSARPDGKAYAVGVTYDGPTWLLATTSAGAPDPAFGSAGLVVLSGQTASDVEATPDNRLVYLAESSTTFQQSIQRRTATGAMDTTFSGDGVVPLGTTAETSLTVQPDGRILVVVGRVGSAVQVRRFTVNGSVDTSFGSGGVATVAVNNESGTGRAIVAAGGDVLVIATTQNSGGSPSTSRAARLTSAGAPRTTFGTSGVKVLPFFAAGAAVDPSGRLLVSCGWAPTGSGCLLRLTTAGQLDPAFAGDGVWESTLSGTPFLGFVGSDPSGRPLVAGYDNQENAFPVSVLRLSTAGVPDSSFAGDGAASFAPCQGSNTAFAMDVDAAGRPLLALACSRSDHGDARAALVRLTTAGAPDSAFDSDGVARFGQVGDRTELGSVVAGMPDGRVVAVGQAEELGITVTRLNRFGAPDTTFSGDGSVAVWVPVAPEALDAAVDAAGRVVILLRRDGPTRGSEENDLVRLTATGALDPTFGTNGRRQLAGVIRPWAMALDGQGRILLTGESPEAGGEVVRLTTTGALDTTFSGDGVVPLEHTQSAVAVDPTGRVLVTEAQWSGDTFVTSVRRLLANGQPDPAFGGGDGQAPFPSDRIVAPDLLATQPDGRVLVCSSSFGAACLRLAADGALDTTYGDRGVAAVSTGRGTSGLDAVVDGLGRTVVAAQSETDGSLQARQLVRVSAAGLPDATFAPGGVVQMPSAGAVAPGRLGLGAASTILGINTSSIGGRFDIAVTRFDNGTSAPATARFVPLAPARLLDTRSAVGTPGTTRPGAGATVTFQATGRGGIPASGVSAVTLTVTATRAAGTGYVTAYASGRARPTASVLNVLAGETIANQVIVPVGADGRVSLFTSAGTHLVADVAGYYQRVVTSAAGRLVTTTPARLLDSRSGPRSAPFATRTVQVAGRGGIPATGATAVVVNVTAVQPSGAGYVTIWPDGSRPTTSNLNIPRPGQTIATHATVRLGADGRIRLASSSSTHLLVDVVGWFTGAGAASSVSGLFVGVGPTRVLDSRSGWTTVGGEGNADLVATGSPVPRRGVDAVVLNLTAAGPRTAGYLTAFPAGTTRPATSNLNVAGRGRTIANLVTVRVPQSEDEYLDGRVNTWTTADTPRLLDVSGWYVRWPVRP